jgi:hypothetical protein
VKGLKRQNALEMCELLSEESSSIKALKVVVSWWGRVIVQKRSFG